MPFATILTELRGETQIITINRPDKLNALNELVINELGKAIDEVHENTSVKSVIITGAGTKAFVAGADISEFLNLDAAAGKALSQKGQDLVFNKIENSIKPFVAAVNGFALGGGCELALACHFRIASDNAKFGQPEVNLGLVPGYGGTQRLTQLVGKGRAMELLLTGSMVTATEALAMGLTNHVTTQEALLGKALEILAVIHTKAPLAIAKIIGLTNLAAIGHADGLQQEINAFGTLMGSRDAKEGAQAFLEKRKPEYKGY